MKAVLKAAFPLLALAAAGCQVNVDDNTAAKLDNAADSIEQAAESAGNAAESAAEGAAGTVENAADRIGDVDVDVGVRTDGNEAAANRQ
ncbi:MAG: hypothetical protein QOG72_3429 [Sphingomonadales bacterium]|nr:hypothetical protein [Sphingomonadales bacterium]